MEKPPEISDFIFTVMFLLTMGLSIVLGIFLLTPLSADFFVLLIFAPIPVIWGLYIFWFMKKRLAAGRHGLEFLLDCIFTGGVMALIIGFGILGVLGIPVLLLTGCFLAGVFSPVLILLGMSLGIILGGLWLFVISHQFKWAINAIAGCAGAVIAIVFCAFLIVNNFYVLSWFIIVPILVVAGFCLGFRRRYLRSIGQFPPR